MISLKSGQRRNALTWLSSNLVKKTTDYLLELRLSGSAKKYVKDIVFDVARKFDVIGVTKNRVVPHVTIIGPIKTNYEQRLINEIIETCMKYDLMTIKFSGFTSFGNWLLGNRKLAIKIEQSSELELLRIELVAKLSLFCQLGKFDTRKWKPHATIAFKDIDKKFGQIKAYLQNRSCPEIKHYVLRVTLLKNARILCEYDFLQRRTLTRFEALNRESKKTTIMLLKKRLAQRNKGLQ
jgi:2'-5' RNA ligase